MDDETKKFIQDTINGSVTALKSEVNTTLASIVSTVKTVVTEVQNLKSAQPETPPGTDTSTPTVDPESAKLKTEMEALKQQLADQKQAALQSEFLSEINQLIASTKDLRSPAIVKDLLLSRWKEKAQKTDAGFQLKLSDTEQLSLTDAYQKFLGSDDGKALLVVKRPTGTEKVPTNTATPPNSSTSSTDSKEQTSLDVFEALYKAEQEKRQAATV